MKAKKTITKSIETRFTVIRTVLGVGIALIIAFILISSVSKMPGETLWTFIASPLSSIRRMGRIIEKAIPLLFTGTAVCIMFSSGQVNLAVEGAFYLSGIACAAVAVLPDFPKIIHPTLSIFVGGICGAIICTIPAIMNVKFKAMTVVSSLMINYICLYVGQYLLHYDMKDPAAGFDASYPYADTARLSEIFNITDIHTGLFIAIATVIIGYFSLYKSMWGISVRMTGKNPDCCGYLGINAPAAIVASSVVGGFIAGMGGAVEQLGMYKRYSFSGLPGYGWDGVMIAVLAQNNPKFVPVAVIFLAYLRVGADVVGQTKDVPVEIINIVQAIIIIFVAADRLLSRWKHKEIVKATQEIIATEMTVTNE